MLGEVLVTLGVVVLLFVGYLLVWTNVSAGQAQAAVLDQIERDWARGPVSGSNRAGAGSAAAGRPARGEGFARMYVPRLRDSVWGTPVVEGVTLPDLARGIGHYPQTALPGRVGNFAVAAHRATHGEPFRDIDRLRVGDLVVVETVQDWYTYRLTEDAIVNPTDVAVIAAVPGKPGAEPTRRLITLTTCDPRWGSTHRWIWWGMLAGTAPKPGPPPAALR